MQFTLLSVRALSDEDLREWTRRKVLTFNWKPDDLELGHTCMMLRQECERRGVFP